MSVLEGDALAEVPQRSNSTESGEFARLVPAILNWQAIEDILKEELEATWLTGKDPAQALSDADQRINAKLQE